MSEVLLGKHVFSVLHYSKTHYMHNWVDMMVAWASSKRDVLVVCFRIINNVAGECDGSTLGS